MLLVVDLGNTNIVFGLYEGSELKHTFRASTVRSRTEDEYASLLQHLLGLHSVPRDAVGAAILASVVPPLTDTLVGAIRHSFAREPLVVGGPGLKTGIKVLFENARDVGADRIVNAVAAHALYKTDTIIVDFGTATTLDCVTATGEYLGGVIVPGVQVSLNALLEHAAKIGPVELAEPPSVIGKNTPHAVQAGIVFGYAALVDGLLGRIEQELGSECRVIATGGLADLISRHTLRVREVRPHLTLEGLRLLHERNQSISTRSAKRVRTKGPS